METPDKWVVIKIETSEITIYKVFASWYGGYLGSDSWRLNSGIKDIETPLEDTYVDFIGYSGSRYRCQDGCYGTSSYSQEVLNRIIESAKNNGAIITIIDEQKTNDWLKLLK